MVTTLPDLPATRNPRENPLEQMAKISLNPMSFSTLSILLHPCQGRWPTLAWVEVNGQSHHYSNQPAIVRDLEFLARILFHRSW
jgi:hypothetical protein